MTPREKVLQSLYLTHDQTEQLAALSKKSGIPKAVLLRDAVNDLLARTRSGGESQRIDLVRAALKKSRARLEALARDLDQRRQGITAIRNCLEVIQSIDLASEALGEYVGRGASKE